MDISASYIEFHNEEVSPSLRRCAITCKGHASTARQPVHLTFVIDTSDSMNDSILSSQAAFSKLQQVKKSIEFLLPLLTPSDYVSMISFGDVSSIHLQQTVMNDEGKKQVQHILRDLRTDGCTNMSAGLLDVQEVLENSSLSMKQGVLLLTDGHANMGISTTNGLESIVTQMTGTNQSLTLTTIGYGKDHNAELLRSMAVVGSGSYNVVYTLEGIATTFGEVLGGLTTVVAQNVTIQLPYGSEVYSGYAKQMNGSHVSVKVGDVYAENEIIVLCDIPASTIIVKGVRMDTLDRLNISVAPTDSSETTPQNVQLAYYRHKVSQFLHKASEEGTPSNTLKQQVRTLLQEMRGLSYSSEVLVQMMIDDLEQILATRRVDPVSMIQHGAYLSLGRGLRSQNPPPSGEEDPHMNSIFSPAFRAMNQSGNIPPIPNEYTGVSEDEQTPLHTPQPQTPPRQNFQSALSPFSNRTQSRNTHIMRTASLQND
jgi:hypothetical protein